MQRVAPNQADELTQLVRLHLAVYVLEVEPLREVRVDEDVLAALRPLQPEPQAFDQVTCVAALAEPPPVVKVSVLSQLHQEPRSSTARG
jgi:hypothetical protein